MSLILTISEVLLQSVVLGMLLVAAVSLFLRAAGELNGSTRGLVWLTTLIALPLIPVLCWTNQLSAPVPETLTTIRTIAPPITPRQVSAPQPTIPATPRALDLSVSRDTPAILATVYAIVAALLLLRLFISYLRIRMLRRRATPAPDEVQARLRHWLARCPTDRNVELGLSDSLRSPVAIGFLRPMILIPTMLTLELSEEEFDDVGVHELAHIRRYDDWTNLLRQVLQAILFFHPAVYWVGRKLKFECEVACDNWVVSARGSKSYARCLAKVVELRRWERGALLSSGAFFSKAQLLRRVELLLDKTRNSKTGISGFTAVAIVLITAGVALQVARIPAMVNITRDNGDSHVNGEWRDGDRDLRVKMRGDMTLAPDERSVASLAPWGYVEIQESRGWTTRRLEVRPGVSGTPEQKYFVDGRERALDTTGRDWVTATFGFVVREMGIDINGRAERILAAKGVAGLLDEVDIIRSSGMKAKYLTRLFEQKELSEEDLRRVANTIRRIPSDHEKAELLRASATRFTSDSARREYYHAVDSIRSDNDKAGVLLTQTGCGALQTATTISSDFEKARVLRDSNVTGASECRDVFFEVVNQIRSDSDRANVLRTLLDHGALEPAIYERVATSSMRMSSDNDKANILTRLSQNYGEPAFFEAVNSIRSDSDRTRVLRQVLTGEPSKAALLAVIGSAARMHSDNETSQILVAAAKISKDSEVRSALKEACGKIHSDTDYRRVATALLSEPAETQ